MKDCAPLIDALLGDVPAFQELYDLHLIEYRELLSHVLMADIVRYVVQHGKEEEQEAGLIRLLGHLEAGLHSGKQDIRDLVGTSFAENLIGEGETLKLLWPLMGPLLRRDVNNFCGTAWMGERTPGDSRF